MQDIIILIVEKSSENMARFRYLGTTVINQILSTKERRLN
jgi:hypothetical protein